MRYLAVPYIRKVGPRFCGKNCKHFTRIFWKQEHARKTEREKTKYSCIKIKQVQFRIQWVIQPRIQGLLSNVWSWFGLVISVLSHRFWSIPFSRSPRILKILWPYPTLPYPNAIKFLPFPRFWEMRDQRTPGSFLSRYPGSEHRILTWRTTRAKMCPRFSDAITWENQLLTPSWQVQSKFLFYQKWKP